MGLRRRARQREERAEAGVQSRVVSEGLSEEQPFVATEPAAVVSREFYYVSPSGHNGWDGKAETYSGGLTGPWQTIGHANQFALSRSTVYIAAGTYGQAPAKGQVIFIGDENTPTNVVITPTITLLSSMSVRGMKTNGKLNINRNSLNCLAYKVHSAGLSHDGDPDAAPTNVTLDGCTIVATTSVANVAAIDMRHNGGDRQLSAPQTTGLTIKNCTITITRTVGSAVLLRLSGVSYSLFENNTFTLTQPDASGGNDDSASVKLIWCHHNTWRGNTWNFVHFEPAVGDTGPFWMNRDDSSHNNWINEVYEINAGGIWYSPNTHGNEDNPPGAWPPGGCSCHANAFTNCLWHCAGPMFFYQCPLPVDDSFTSCKIRCDDFDLYNTGSTPAGLDIDDYIVP